MCAILFIARYFVVFAGIICIGLYSIHAEEKKALAVESAVFDLKSSSSLMVYGNVSDKKRHPVSDATVTLKPSRGSAKETASDSAGLYSFTGVEDGISYSLSASKEGLGRTKKVNFKIKKGETNNFVIGLNFKKVSVRLVASRRRTPTTTPSSNGKPEDLVHIPLYSSANPFVKKIESNPEIDPNSDAMVEGIVSQAAIGFVIAQKQWTVPVFYADENTPRYDVTLKCGKEWEIGVTKLKNVPIPDWAEPSDDDHEGGINPDGCGGSDNGPDEGDFAMAVIDTSTRCEYDFWQAKKTKGKWAASWANSISIDSDGIFEKGFPAGGQDLPFERAYLA